MEGPVLCLNNNVKMPQIGLGTYKASGSDVVNAVLWATEAGMKLIDTASIYKVRFHARVSQGYRYTMNKLCISCTTCH